MNYLFNLSNSQIYLEDELYSDNKIVKILIISIYYIKIFFKLIYFLKENDANIAQTILLAANSKYFHPLLDSVKRVRKYLENWHIIIYDLGISTSMKNQVILIEYFFYYKLH